MSMNSEITIVSGSTACHVHEWSGVKIRTLVVDDTPDLLSAICGMLEADEAVEVVGTATDGAEAVSTAQELCPDLVIMDVSMPVMNGLEAAVRLTEKLPQMKLVMMSADDDVELQEACRDCGADVFLWKGRISGELLNRIRELFPQPTPSCTPCEYLSAGAAEVSVYDFHNQHYEYYRDLLEYAQGAGRMQLARSAARMLLFHLRQMFCSLPRNKQQLLKQEFAQSQA